MFLVLKGIVPGDQPWPYSLTGERGEDAVWFGFGINDAIGDDSKVHFYNWPVVMRGIYQGIEAPRSLPENLEGENILETLNVQ